MVIENRGGAGTNIGAELVARAIVGGTSPDELARLIESDIAKWGQLIGELGITVGD